MAPFDTSVPGSRAGSLVLAKLPPWEDFLNVPYCCGPNARTYLVCFVCVCLCVYVCVSIPTNHKRLKVDIS